jgi:hypothetical protein
MDGLIDIGRYMCTESLSISPPAPCRADEEGKLSVKEVRR